MKNSLKAFGSTIVLLSFTFLLNIILNVIMGKAYFDGWKGMMFWMLFIYYCYGKKRFYDMGGKDDIISIDYVDERAED